MIDRDLAELYGVETKRLNEAVKRNIERFPERFRFQLTKEEMAELVANCDRFNSLKHSTVRSYAFTEQGVAMLSTVLRSETAIRVSIRIHQKNWWKESIESNQYATLTACVRMVPKSHLCRNEIYFDSIRVNAKSFSFLIPLLPRYYHSIATVLPL